MICNAGGFGSDSTPTHIRDFSVDTFRSVLDLNLVGPFVLTKHALPHLEKTKGNILYVSSVGGQS